MKRKFRVSVIGNARRIRQERQEKVRGRLVRCTSVFVGFLAVVFLLRGFIVLVLLQILAFVFTPVLPQIDDATALYASQSTIIYDREGSSLYTIHGDENRFEIPLKKMPESIKLATIAAEDDEFFNHSGFDVDGIIRAVISELGVGPRRGGSTITQQLVKNAYLSPERTYWRKLQELLLSLKLENKFSKEEILEMYLNRIPYGSNAYGIQAAAQTFFAKNSEDLTLAEAAVLAGLPQAPSRYSPYGQNRDQLMGVCGKEELKTLAVEAEVAPLTLTVTDTVWLRVSTDGVITKEWTAYAGEVAKFPFEKRFSILSGNNNFELNLNGTRIPTNNDRNFLFERKDTPLPVVMTSVCDNINDPDYTSGRKDYVFRRMLDLGFISQDEFDKAWQEANALKFTVYREPISAPHFVFYVRDLLEKRYGKDLVERGGLRVFTTLDLKLQEKTEELIADAFPRQIGQNGEITWSQNRFNATNAALLAMDNETGQIRAMVGSRDYFEVLDENGWGNDGATNLTTRLRQPGSSFKPFVYAAGLLAGYTPASVLWDVKTNFGKGTDEYTPSNYDGKFMGPMSLRRALSYSRNIPAVKMAILAGESAIVKLAKNLGLEDVSDEGLYGPTIGLGVSEVSMMQMVIGYSVFANEGKRVTSAAILKITDSKGNVIDEFEPQRPLQVIDPKTTYLVTNILSDVSARPAGWNGNLNLVGRPNAAKTGTANKRISEDEILPGDVWTIGFTPQFTAAVWVGNNDGSPMNVAATGLTTAGPIWHNFMEYAHNGLPAEEFKTPEGIVKRSVSRMTGKLVSSTTPTNQISVETFADFAVPLEIDDAFIEVTVDEVSGKLPTAFTPESAKVKKIFVNLHSERPHDSEWERPVYEWLKHSSKNENTVFTPPPTEHDDVHTTATVQKKPSISIISPVSGSTVQKRSIGIWVDVSAAHGVEKVEYFRDGNLVATATSAPWKGVLPIPLRAEDGRHYKLTAKIYDKLFYTDTSSVEVTVGEDTQRPTVRIIAPAVQQKVARGTTLLVKAEAFDAGGDVKKVEFWLDGARLDEFTYPPFELPIVIRSSTRLGTHRLKVIATDTTGLTATSEVKFGVVEGAGNIEDFSIILPVDGAVVPVGKTKIEVVAQINRDKFTPIKINFIVRDRETNNRRTFATLDNPVGGTFSVSWSDFTSGEYEIYFKAHDINGKTIISGRNLVIVR